MLEKIKEQLLLGKNYSEIAKILLVHRTTISKICKRNGIEPIKTLNINCCVCNKVIKNNNKNNTKCKTCVTRLRRLKLKIKAVEYLGGKCEKCGYSEHLAALTFHHINPEDKDFNISNVKHKSWNFIEKELDKCILLCSNCHNIEHSKYSDDSLIKYI